MWGTSSGNAYQNAPSANTLYDAGTQRYNQDTGQLQQATPQWRGPGFTLTSSGNVPSNLLTPGSQGGSRPISLPSSSGGPGTPGWVKPAWTGSQSALQQQAFGSIPPLQEANGKDTEFGMLLKMGPQGRDPGKERRFQQLMSEWQASHPAPTAAPATQPTPPPVSTPMEQRGTPPTLTGATGLLGGLGNFIGGLFGGGVSPAQTAQSKATQGLQAKSLPTTGLTGQPIHPGSWFGLPDIGLTEKISDFLKTVPTRTLQGGSNIMQDVWHRGQGFLEKQPWLKEFAPWQEAEKNFLAFLNPYATPGQRFEQLQYPTRQPGRIYDMNGRDVTDLLGGTPPEKGTPQIVPTTKPEERTLGGQATGKQAEQLLTQYKANPTAYPRSTVAAALANDTGIKTINKNIDIAQKSGNFDEVARLTDLAREAQSNMIMQQQIQSIMDAIASSFGVNPAALTAERAPMVQQGTFQALETPPQQPFTFFGNPREDMGGQPVFFPNQLREINPAQMNRPPQFPYANPMMGQNPLGNSPFTTGGQPTNQFLYGKSSVI